MKIKEILKIGESDKNINVKGWVRTKRGSKHVSFIALNDGSTINSIQVIAEGKHFKEELIKQITTGSCIAVNGELVNSKGSGQSVEILASSIEILDEPWACPKFPCENLPEFFKYWISLHN